MSNYMEHIMKSELIEENEISYEDYRQAQKALEPEEFILKYKEKKDRYYKISTNVIEPEEVEAYLLLQILKEQRQTKKSIKVIKGIMIAYAVITGIGLFFFLVSNLM